MSKNLNFRKKDFSIKISLINPYWQISAAWARPIFNKNWIRTRIDGWIFQKPAQLIVLSLIPRKSKFRKNTGWVIQKSVCGHSFLSVNFLKFSWFYSNHECVFLELIFRNMNDGWSKLLNLSPTSQNCHQYLKLVANSFFPCWWQVYKTICVDDKFAMLVSDLRFLLAILHIEEITNKMTLRPAYWICHHNCHQHGHLNLTKCRRPLLNVRDGNVILVTPLRSL